jgi:tungstate transport system substrate-binding protein
MFSTRLYKPLISLAAVILVIALMLALAGCSTTSSTTTSSAKPASSTSVAATSSPAPVSSTSSVKPTTTLSSPTTTNSTPAASTTTTSAVKHANNEVLMSSTTSTRDSGLMDVLQPLFEQKSGYKLKPIYNGSGAAMTLGQKGEADVLLVHAPDSEVTFVADGWGINRKLVMHNDFILVGPSSDPAGIKGMTKAADALKKIADAKIAFYSRGDNSGTDQLEKKLWASVGVTVKDGAATNPSWYIEGGSGTGMGQLLLVASDKTAYTITDRATFLSYQSKIASNILVQGDPALLNVYHVIQVNPAKYPGIINADGAKAFVDFMISPDTQSVIAKFGQDKYGQPLFFADATKTEADLGSK